ncbi:MAG: XRE family transcriptional regulator [Acidimicrobiales bacterium]
MNASNIELAESVRRLRSERQWTLDHAAARLGISRRLLAQIEAGEANPSLSTLLAIADGFDLHLSELLAPEPSTSPVTLGHLPADAPVQWSTPTGSEARLLAGRGPLELWTWSLQPGDERTSDAHRAGSMEAVHVINGTVTLEVGTETVSLGAGSSAIFEASLPHAYRNDRKRVARFLLTVNDPVV